MTFNLFDSPQGFQLTSILYLIHPSYLEDLLSHDTEINNFRIDHEFDQLVPKTMMINVRKIPPLSGNPLILMAINDLGDRQDL